MKKPLLLLCLLFLFAITATVTAQTIATYDTATIYDIQFIPPESLAVGQDDSPFLGDTVIVEGVVASGPRSLWARARWSMIIVDENGGPWNALQVIQHDTTAGKEATGITGLRVGYKVRFTGLIEEYSNGYPPTQTQIALLTDPPVLVEPIGFGYNIPQPMEIICSDLAMDIGEKYEATLVVIRNVTVLNNALPSQQMLIVDTSGQVVVDDWFNDLSDSIYNGLYAWPDVGTKIDITGHVRSNPYGTGLNISPRTSADIIIYTTPPIISNVTRNPAAPTSNDNVMVSAKIKDSNGTVEQAQVYYKANDGNWQFGSMTTSDSIYTFSIPNQADGIMVQYFIKAIDNDGHFSMTPGDTSSLKFLYTVRDNALLIKDVQWTPFRDGNSPYLGYEVTISGIVTASPDDFLGDYVIQSSQEPWSGIWVDDAVHLPQRGDSIRVTGTVQEDYTYTRLSLVAAFETLGSGYNIEPLKLTTGQATTGSSEAEQYEGMLLQFENVIVSDPFPDTPYNNGEFVIDDGSNGYRVDDESITFRGNLDSTFVLNDKIEKIVGIGYYSFYEYKLQPRGEEDIIGHIPVVSVKDRNNHLEISYELKQNYPNPFNPTTMIYYSIAKNGFVELTVYNILGQKIKTLVNEVKNAGQHVVQWDGLNNSGQLVVSGLYFYTLKSSHFIKTNKMILLR